MGEVGRASELRRFPKPSATETVLLLLPVSVYVYAEIHSVQNIGLYVLTQFDYKTLSIQRRIDKRAEYALAAAYFVHSCLGSDASHS